MKTYTITVNGTAYDVTVEENVNGAPAAASAGQAVKKGEVVLLLEAMKMENEVVAPQDGTIATINVAAGDMVEAGNVLATMN